MQIDKIESNKTGYFQLHITNIKKKYGNVTFNNFLLYVLSTKGDPNEHWIPFYKTCSYCNFGYDQFIGRMEIFERDMWYADIQLVLSSMIYFIDARSPQRHKKFLHIRGSTLTQIRRVENKNLFLSIT